MADPLVILHTESSTGWGGQENRTGVMDIQSHTHTHPLCRVGQETDEAKLREELRRSREAIEGHLGTSCRYLCWPRGWFNDAAIRIAREEGYEACFSTPPGANGPRADLGALRRIDVRRGGAAWPASLYLRLKGEGSTCRDSGRWDGPLGRSERVRRAETRPRP